MNIMKFAGFHARIMKIKKKQIIIKYQNHESHEIHRIPLQNYENQKNDLFIARITKFIKFQARLTKIMKT